MVGSDGGGRLDLEVYLDTDVAVSL
jgi:hypothetical protein